MTAVSNPAALPADEAATYAEWFASLGDPTRVRLLHAVATAPGGTTVGELTEQLGISQSTCSHHIRKLADLGLLALHKQGTATRVWIDQACCSGLPHAADAVMGMLAARPCCPEDVPEDLDIRAMREEDWPSVRTIYGQGIATGLAGFEVSVPSRTSLDEAWLDGHRWVAERHGVLVGWTALATVSPEPAFSGVAESSIHVADGYRGQGIGRALIRRQVIEADNAGLWTLQGSVLTANRAAIALHHAAGYRTVGVRERVARRGDTWHDTILLERRIDAVTRPSCGDTTVD